MHFCMACSELAVHPRRLVPGGGGGGCGGSGVMWRWCTTFWPKTLEERDDVEGEDGAKGE